MSTRSYVVVHDTRYDYAEPVSLSRQIVHLTPRATAYQTCRDSLLRIEPAPEILGTGKDAFGNAYTSLCIDTDHEALAVHAESRVEVRARDYPDDARTPPERHLALVVLIQ